jgi:hypothetical protein
MMIELPAFAGDVYAIVGFAGEPERRARMVRAVGVLLGDLQGAI